jgi:histidinol-phosphate aminotransferase
MSELFVAPGIARLTPYQAGLPAEQIALKYGLAHVIKLASNENPFGPSPKAMEAAAKALSDSHRYPDDDAHDLRAALAQRHGVRPEQVVLTAGSTDLFELVVHCFATQESHAVISAGSFIAYKLFLSAFAVPFAEVPLRDFAVDLDGMASAVRPETRIIFLPNPNNPTGSRFGAQDLDRFLARISPDILVVLDDAYVEFVEAADAPDAVAILRLRPRTVVARTFSKLHGLAGLRVGFGIATEEVASALLRARRPFSVTRVSLSAARAALDDREHIARTLAATTEGRAFFSDAFAEIGLRALPSHANFVAVILGDERNAARVAEALLRRGLIVRALGPFGLPGLLRVSVGTRAENEALVRGLREVL